MFIQGGRPAAELEWLKDGKPVTELQKVGKDYDWVLGMFFSQIKLCMRKLTIVTAVEI